MSIKRYSELITLPTFEERFDYLSLNGVVGEPTFGGLRFLNQAVYNNSYEWKRIRREVILRDNGCDLAHQDCPIGGPIYVHHINPLTLDDIKNAKECVFDPENLISVSFTTHNAIHYGNKKAVSKKFAERRKNDTCPWRCK